MQLETVEGLRKIPFLAGIPENVLLKLAEHGVRKTYPKNVIIINEGDEAGPLFILLTGKVRVFVSNEDGKEVTLSMQQPGSYFGELSILDDAPRSASVICTEPTTCALIAKTAFTAWLKEYPDAALSIIRGLTQKIRALTENVKTLALLDVYGRTVKALENLAVEENGQKVIRDKLSHQDLSNLVGSSREMVSKIMKDLTVGGYISVDGKTLRIHRNFPSCW